MKFKHVLGRRYLVSTRKGTPVVLITARDRKDLRLLEKLSTRHRVEATDLLA
jgi:hypothetical protein